MKHTIATLALIVSACGSAPQTQPASMITSEQQPADPPCYASFVGVVRHIQVNEDGEADPNGTITKGYRCNIFYLCPDNDRLFDWCWVSESGKPGDEATLFRRCVPPADAVDTKYDCANATR